MIMIDKFMFLLNDSANAMLHPKPDTFRQQLGHANMFTGIVWVTIAGAITGFVQAAMLMYVYIDAFTGPVPSHITLSLSVSLVTRSVGMAITAVMLLLGLSIAYYVVSSMTNGKGNFNIQTYLIATYTAPLFIIAGVLFRVLQLSFVFSFLYGYAFIQDFLYLFAGGLIFFSYHIYLSNSVIQIIYDFGQQKSFKVTQIFVGAIVLITFGYATFTIGLPLLFFQFVRWL